MGKKRGKRESSKQAKMYIDEQEVYKEGKAIVQALDIVKKKGGR